MPKPHRSRHASMQVWPRVRAARHFARVRAWTPSKDTKPLGFAGYKVGMTHLIITDNRKNAMTKGEEVSWPATIIECPPLKVAGIRFYKKGYYGNQVATEILGKLDKEAGRKIILPKKPNEQKLQSLKAEDYTDIRLLVCTQPKLTGIGKKKPELFELGLGGSVGDKFVYAKEQLGKELSIKDVFAEGTQVDVQAVSKGKGFQGPVKRFGVKIRQHKSEKTKRGPGSLGGWSKQGHVMYRVAFAGQMGYHQRIDYNKLILKVCDKPDEINKKGGFVHYGIVKNPCILVKGSVVGTSNRLIRLMLARNPNRKFEGPVPAINHISTTSQQGN
ncbi:50S ribosomal protein L3 [Candidatus Woesearchaeota archaeon]|nr:50S ribosomal protein L3 [Candidatus Woesearchaeota archaeon]